MKPLYRRICETDDFLATIEGFDVYRRPDIGFYYVTFGDYDASRMVVYSTGKTIHSPNIPQTVVDFCKAHHTFML